MVGGIVVRVEVLMSRDILKGAAMRLIEVEATRVQ